MAEEKEPDPPPPEPWATAARPESTSLMRQPLTRPARVFLSYVHDDDAAPAGTHGFVTFLRGRLHRRLDPVGMLAPRIFDDREVALSEPIPAQLERAVDQADVFLVVLSRHWLLWDRAAAEWHRRALGRFAQRWQAAGEPLDTVRARIVVASLDDDVPSDSVRRPRLLQWPDDYVFFERARSAHGKARPFYADGKVQDARCEALADALAEELLRKLGPRGMPAR